MNRQKPNKWILYTTRYLLPLFVLAGIGTTTYVIYNLVTRGRESTRVKYDLGTARTSEDKFFVLYPFEKDGPFLFSQDELNQLEQDFLSEQYYGPELAEVNNVIFGDRNVVDPESGVSGLTIPQTKQIFISISGLATPVRDLTFDEKENYLFSVLAHEYGHHFTSTYFNNTNKFNGNGDIYIDDASQANRRSVEYWNRQYINDFKGVFNIDTPLGDDLQNQYFPPSSGLPNVSSAYSLNELYHSANDETADPLPMSRYNYGNINQQYPNRILQLRDNTNTYLYSQDEIGTRMLQQVFYSHDLIDWGEFEPTNPANFNDVIKFFRDPWNNTRSREYDPYMQDLYMTASFKLNKTSDTTGTLDPQVIYPNYVWTAPYEHAGGTDNLTNRSGEYYDDLIQGMGYGKDIAKMWFKNETFTLNGQFIEHHDDSNYYNPNLLKWIGYTQEPATDIVAVDPADGKVVEGNNALDIKISERTYGSPTTSVQNPAFNFFAKKDRDSMFTSDISDSRAELTDAFWNPTDFGYASQMHSYITTDYVNANTLRNALDRGYQLHFATRSATDWVVVPEPIGELAGLNNFGQTDTVNGNGQVINPTNVSYVSSYPQGILGYYDNVAQSPRFWTFVWDNSTKQMKLEQNFY